MDKNRLSEETSPYLLQHKDNPVHWQAWNAATLAAAKEADKPILLSVGYAACHWGHVMAHESCEGSAQEISIGLFARIAERLLREVDPLNGGIGTAPKFPQAGIFELLWRAWKRTRLKPYREAVLRTLTTISQGGIYDHLGGGYARYATDARWLVPHFEKMLYDNAELISLFTLVWP